MRVRDWPGWRWALLFRDWLRASPDARAEYAELKHRLAAEFEGDGTADRYAEAKEPWMAEAYGRSEAWARRTGWASP